MEEEAQEYLNLARQLSSNGSYSKAFDLYIMAFDKNPDLKTAFESEFRVVLIQLNEVLVEAGKMEDIFANFGKAVEVFPDNSNLLNDIGKYLYKFAFYTEALAHFQKALKLDRTFVNAEKNLNSVKNLLIDRWHYRMLNDKIRNDAYFEALSESIGCYKDSILDIGTGTGLLALFASQCSATAITGIESSELMAWMAECIAQDNNKHDIVIVNKMSTTLNYRDIGGKRSLVVTEMFDAGLFGEHVLETLSHAWEYFTIPTTRIIPNKAEFFVVAAKSDHLNRKYQLGLSVKNLLNITHLNVHVLTFNEPYDCEDVYLFNDIKYMSKPQSVVKVDFNDYRDIQDKINGTEPYNVQFTAEEAGEINTFIGWFNLYLTPKVTLTTDPKSDKRANAWQQAVFFDNIPMSVIEKQTIGAQFLLNEGKLSMVNENDSKILRISLETLRFLNDDDYLKNIISCIGMACIYLGQMADLSNISIVDLSPFPLFGMLMLKRGAQSLFCHAKTSYDRKFFKKVFKANKVSWSKVIAIVGDEWDHDSFKNEKFHGIFFNIFDLSGDIDSRLLELASHLRTFNLHQGGLVMPANIQLLVQIVHSPWLDINNRVYDENVRNYKVANHINKYEVTQNFCIDFSRLEYTEVTDVLNLGSIYSEIKSEVVPIPITHGGPANAILCWYNIELMNDLGSISTKRKECFIDGTLFVISPKSPLTPGKEALLMRCTDTDGSFKIMLEKETT